jgi:hypothetical protein
MAAEKTQSTVNHPATQNANSLTQAAVKAGVRTCANRINQVSNFLTAGAKDAGYMMSFPPKNPDQQMSSISMEIPLKDASSAYATASFAPDQANGCTGMYETVVYWPQNCMKWAKRIMANSKRSACCQRILTYVMTAYQRKSF